MKLPEIDSKIAKKIIVDFIKEIKNKTNVDGIVIGLSGGIDSTIVAYLLKEAIGSENVYSYHLYSSTTPKEDTDHARLIANLLNISYKELNIDNVFSEFLNLTNNNSGLENKVAKGNLNARIRMSLLYYFANLNNCLVAGTGNKSELLIGYFTKYGDGACDFEPIANIYKTQLRKLATSYEIPNEIIDKPPRAGLWEDQTDEDEIGFSYEVLDQLLYLVNDKKLNNEDILHELSDEDILHEMDISEHDINSVRRKIDKNQHKSHFPPSPMM